MITTDVNVLVDANRPSSPRHLRAKGWLEMALVADEPLGLWSVTLVSAYRLLTDPKIWTEPETPQSALGYLNAIRRGPAVTMLEPGTQFWAIFDRVCQDANVRGPLTSDAMLAAFAIEHCCRIATYDSELAKFKGVTTFAP